MKKVKCYLTTYDVFGGSRVDLGIPKKMGISYYAGNMGTGDVSIIKEGKRVVGDESIAIDINEEGFEKFIKYLEKKDSEDRSRIVRENLRFIGTLFGLPLPFSLEI